MSKLLAQRAATRATGATIDALLMLDDGRLADAATYLDEAQTHLARARQELQAVTS